MTEKDLADMIEAEEKRLGLYSREFIERHFEIMETADLGETDFRSLIEGDRKYGQDDNLGEHGYTEQEFQGEELIDVEEEPDDDEFDDMDLDDMEYEPDDDFGYDDLSDDE